MKFKIKSKIKFLLEDDLILPLYEEMGFPLRREDRGSCTLVFIEDNPYDIEITGLRALAKLSEKMGAIKLSAPLSGENVLEIGYS